MVHPHPLSAAVATASSKVLAFKTLYEACNATYRSCPEDVYAAGLKCDFQSPAPSAGVSRHHWFKSRVGFEPTTFGL